MYHNEQTWISINQDPQFVSIRAEKKDAPLLLYLHGGPGDAALPLVRRYNRELEEHFTVAVWEQRGAGKSYRPFDEKTPVTIALFLEDLRQLAEILLERYHQEKLYLIGHSWGSVLGLRFITEHPELVRAYIGCGQVVNMKKACQSACRYAISHADSRTAAALEKIDCSYTGENWLRDLLCVTKRVVKYKGSLYGKSSYLALTTPFLFSGLYSPADLLNRQKGSLQSIRRLWPELMETDFEGQTQFEVPVIFVEGRHDHHVSSALAKQYYDTIRTEKQFHWFEKSCHFPQWSESGKFNQLLIGLAKG